MTDKNNDDVTANANSTASYSLGRTGVIITTLGFMVFAGAFGYGYFELSKVNVSLARMVSELKSQQQENQLQITQLQQSLSQNMNAQPAQQQSPAVQTSEASLYKVTESQSLVDLARMQLNVTHDAAAGLVSLQHALELLQTIQNPALDPIRLKLAENIAALNQAQQIDITSIYKTLTTISDQIDKLQLPPAPLQEVQQDKPKNYAGLPWWKVQWHKTMDSLRKIVIVKYTGATEMPLIMPEEKMYLYQNLHAQLQVVMVALMNRDAAVYSAGLVRMTEWVQKYFVQDAELTKTVIEQLNSLKQIDIMPPVIDIAVTQNMFTEYLAQTSQQQPAAQ